MVGSSGSYQAIAGGKKMKGIKGMRKSMGKSKMSMTKGKVPPIMHGQQKVSDFGIAKGSAVRKKKGMMR